MLQVFGATVYMTVFDTAEPMRHINKAGMRQTKKTHDHQGQNKPGKIQS